MPLELALHPMLRDSASIKEFRSLVPKSYPPHQMTSARARLEDSVTYLVPYLPVTPTFFVRFVILADAVMNDAESCVLCR